jgi:uncharacterized membrane protein YfcA
MSELLILLGAGLFAGTLGGLLGLGGGIVLMPLLRFGFNLSPFMAAGTCIVAVFFTTLGGSYRHFRMGHVRFAPIVPVILAGAISVVIASLAFGRLATRGHWIDLGIGLVFSLIAIRMLIEGIPGISRIFDKTDPPGDIEGSLPAKMSIGATAGALPGLLGIGTGGILVPAFTFLLKAPIKAAIGASLVCFCLNSLISASFKLAQGFVDLHLALPVCLGTLFGANLGARLNGRLSSYAIKLVFGIVFGYVAAKFIASFMGVRI